MFRKMRRFKQQITEEECIQILKNTKRGILSLIGDDGYPYGIPLDHWYSEEDNAVYFHGAKEGHKIDAIKGPVIKRVIRFIVKDIGMRVNGLLILQVSLYLVE